MDFNNVLDQRYSCKKFNGVKVEESVLNKILEAQRKAPTAKNYQPQHIYVVESEDMLKKIDELTPCRYNAATVLVVAYDKNNVFTYPGEKRDSGIEDATIIATYLMLAARNEGIDSCWVNFFNPEHMHDALKLPENEEILMMMDLGYKDSEFKPLPNHYSRKELKDTVTKI